ncbi:Hypothetical predicted protein [Mytilus galloprovincialis]|uniref:Uncharacterized protein n=1 Tax=Mytilus galloprovincialis TaxID=29158 RepID=A0A8B6D7H8_MYTGA|nr:Hypothetical predicted protein [Mytilus galloprovincialis]
MTSNYPNMPMQMMASPFVTSPTQQMVPPFFPCHTPAPVVNPPLWATDLMSKFDALSVKMNGIDDIKSYVTNIDQKVTDMQSDMVHLSKRVNEVENSQSFISKSFEENIKMHEKTNKKVETDLKKLTYDFASLRKEFNSMKTESKNLAESKENLNKIAKANERLNSDLETIQRESMRDNLLFHDRVDELFAYVADETLPDRSNPDPGTNDYGTKLINLCKCSGLRILNGRHEGSLANDYTYSGPKGTACRTNDNYWYGACRTCRTGRYAPGFNHNHVVLPGTLVAVQLTAHVKNQAVNNIHQPASTIVDTAYVQHADPELPEGSRPKVTNLLRTCNRVRQKLRPEEPHDLDFERLKVLSTARSWYLDGTFKVVRNPFAQMFSIHAFLTSGGSTKQVPLAFCMMSRRLTRDYKAFSYNRRDDVFSFCRNIMALPLLPASHIEPTFRELTSRVTDPALEKFTSYVRKTWITSAFYQIATWCVFNQPTRTNNDVEGWHRRLNKKNNDEKPAFYTLIKRLHEEAQLLPIQIKLVSEGKLTRYQRKQARTNQAILFNMWEQYIAGSISTTRLLRQCGRVNGPVVEANTHFSLIILFVSGASM